MRVYVITREMQNLSAIFRGPTIDYTHDTVHLTMVNLLVQVFNIFFLNSFWLNHMEIMNQ